MSELKKEIIKRIFPKDLASLEDLEQRYPKRDLDADAIVSRIAPSPTGFIHLGSLYTALISERLAHQSEGIFLLRIEDTDKKREVPGSVQAFVKNLADFKLQVDEGVGLDKLSFGSYGPYIQSERSEIYLSVIKHLYEQDLAYACFASPEELEELRDKQEAMSERSGYWGHFASWRKKDERDVLEALDAGLKPVIRFKSPGDFRKKIEVNDLLLGKRDLPENDQDIIILKRDGLPTYHLAHMVDDHFMRISHVIRGNEWFPSLPLHLQLYSALGWSAPKFAHLAPIQKLEEGKKRKLSKRKDPEANIEYYSKLGYLAEVIIEYLLNLANSNFEDWRLNNPELSYDKFTLSWKKLANSNGPLFDQVKLDSISRNHLSRLSALNLYELSLDWAKKYDTEFAKLLLEQKEYIISILDIERRDTKNPRKDFSSFSQLKDEISYFFPQLFKLDEDKLREIKEELKGLDIKYFLKAFLNNYDFSDAPEEGFDKLKKLAIELGYAPNLKSYQAEPDKHKGQVGSLAKLLRFLITGRLNTPNLFLIIKILGKEILEERINKFV